MTLSYAWLTVYYDKIYIHILEVKVNPPRNIEVHRIFLKTLKEQFISKLDRNIRYIPKHKAFLRVYIGDYV